MLTQYLIENYTLSQLSSLSAEDLNKHIQDKINKKTQFTHMEVDNILNNKNLSSDHMLTLTQNLDLIPTRANHHALFLKAMTTEKNPAILNQHAYAFLQSPHIDQDGHLVIMAKAIKTGNPSMPVDTKLRDRILLQANNSNKLKKELDKQEHDAKTYVYQPSTNNKYLMQQELNKSAF